MRKCLLLAGFVLASHGASAAALDDVPPPAGFPAVTIQKAHGFGAVTAPVVKQQNFEQQPVAPTLELAPLSPTRKTMLLKSDPLALPRPATAAAPAPQVPLPDVAKPVKIEAPKPAEVKPAVEIAAPKKLPEIPTPTTATLPAGPTPLMSLQSGAWTAPAFTDSVSETPLLDGSVLALRDDDASGPYSAQVPAVASAANAAPPTPQEPATDDLDSIVALVMAVAMKLWKFAALALLAAVAVALKVKLGKRQQASAPQPTAKLKTSKVSKLKSSKQGASLLGRLFSRGRSLSRA